MAATWKSPCPLDVINVETLWNNVRGAAFIVTGGAPAITY